MPTVPSRLYSLPKLKNGVKWIKAQQLTYLIRYTLTNFTEMQKLIIAKVEVTQMLIKK